MRTYRPAPVTVMPRRPGNDDLLTALVILISLGLFASVFGNVSMIEAMKEQQERETKTVLCFNADGDVTSGEDWKECRMVYVRESVY